MRIRNLVSSAAIVAALLSSSSLVTFAMSQKGIVGTPSSDWAITKVDDAGGAYCALARKYSTNAVMTFAQNSADEASFALDFQRPILQTGENMSVILDPGAGQDRSFNIQPVSSKAFVVRLGQDAAFFNALEESGLLRVVTAGQTYHFSVADMEAGSERMQGCIASITEPASGSEQNNNPASLTRKNAANESELQNKLENAQQKNDELQAQVERLKASVRSDQELKELTMRLNQLQSENLRLAERLQNVNESVAEEGSYQEQLAKLTAENNILKTDLAQKNTDSALVEQLRQKIAKAETENNLLQETAAKSRSALEQEAQQKISVIEQQLIDQKTENEQKAIALEKFGKTAEQLAALEEVNRGLQDKVAAMQAEQSEAAALKERLATLEAEYKGLTEKLELAQNELPVAQETIAALKSENEILQQNLAEKEAGATKSLSAIEEKYSSLKEIVKNLIPVAEKYKEESARKQQDIAALEQALEEKFAEYQASTEETEGKLQQLTASQQELEAHKVRTAELQKALKEIIAVADRYKASSEEKDLTIAELQKAAEDKASELAALQEDKAKTAEDQLAQISAFEAEKLSLQDQLAQMTVLENEKTELQNKLTASVDSVKALEQQIADAQQAYQESEQKIASLQAELQALSDENGQIKAEMEAALNAIPSAGGDESEASSSSADGSLGKEHTVQSQEPAPVSEQPAVPEAKQGTETESAASSSEESEPSASSSVVFSSPPMPMVAPSAKNANVPKAEPKAEQRETQSRMAIASTRAPAPVPPRKAKVPVAELAEVMPAPSQSASQAAQLKPPVAAAQAPAQPSPQLQEPLPDISGMNEAQRLEMEVARNLQKNRNGTSPQQPALGSVKDVPSPQQSAALSSAAIEQEVIAAPELQQPMPSKALALKQAMNTKTPMNDLPAMLGKANIANPSDVQPVKEAVAGAQAYKWKNGDVYGTAEQRRISSEREFDGLVKNYIERTQSRCPGDFAVVPTDSRGEGANRADSYEVACVGSNVSSGASLLFFNQNGVFTVVAHEAPTESLGRAIDSRDQVLKALNSGS